ncbi:MAG: hypothetical protein ABEK36_00460 [Candidatus Aenigmatarchaeota archaeon]
MTITTNRNLVESNGRRNISEVFTEIGLSSVCSEASYLLTHYDNIDERLPENGVSYLGNTKEYFETALKGLKIREEINKGNSEILFNQENIIKAEKTIEELEKYTDKDMEEMKAALNGLIDTLESIRQKGRITEDVEIDEANNFLREVTREIENEYYRSLKGLDPWYSAV